MPRHSKRKKICECIKLVIKLKKKQERKPGLRSGTKLCKTIPYFYLKYLIHRGIPNQLRKGGSSTSQLVELRVLDVIHAPLVKIDVKL